MPEEDGKDYYCRKIRQKIRGDVQIIRSCGLEEYVNLAGQKKRFLYHSFPRIQHR